MMNHRCVLICVCLAWLQAGFGPACAQPAPASPDQTDAASKEESSARPDLEQLDFASGLFHRGMFEMAIKEYKKFIERYPQAKEVGEALFGIAESHFFSDNLTEAREAYLEYIGRFPKEEKASLCFLRIGQTHFRQQEYAQALTFFKKVRPEQLDNRFAQILYFTRARAYRQTGQPVLAQKDFEKAAGFTEDSQMATYALLEAGDISAAAGEYDRALDYYRRAEQNTVLDNLRSTALAKQGKMLYRQGHYDRLLELLIPALEKFAAQPAWSEILLTVNLAQYAAQAYAPMIALYEQHRSKMAMDESFFPVHYAALNAYLALGKRDKAFGLANTLFDQSGLSAESRRKVIFKKAELLLKSNQYQQTLDLLNSTEIDDAGRNQQVLFYRAEAYYGLEDYNQAYITYKTVYEDYPQTDYAMDSLYGMAHCQNAKGYLREAADLFVRYYKESKETGKRQEALYNAVLISAKLEEHNRAIGYCEQYLEQFAGGERREQVLYLLATFYPKVDRYDRGVEALRRYITEYPESSRLAEAHFQLAFNLQKTGQLEDALVTYARVYAPDNPLAADTTLRYSAMKNAALVLLERDRLDEAAGLFERLIKEFDQKDLEAKTYLWLAQYNLKREKFDKALSALERMPPELAAEVDSLAVAYFKGEAYRGLNDCDKAMAFYDIVIRDEEEDPYAGAAYLGKGQCLVTMFDYEQAREQFEQAVVNDPDDHTVSMRARFELGNVAEKMGEVEEAIRFYMLVAVLYQDDYYTAESLVRAGSLFEQLERTEEARRAYQEVLDKYGDSPAAAKAKQRLEGLNV